jgi:hypothetical protein
VFLSNTINKKLGGTLLNLKDKLNNNSIISENPLHSDNAGLTNLSSFFNSHSEAAMYNLIYNDHLDDNQIK